MCLRVWQLSVRGLIRDHTCSHVWRLLQPPLSILIARIHMQGYGCTLDMHAHTHCAYIYISAWTDIRKHIHTANAHIHVFMCTCIHVCIWVSLLQCTYSATCTRMYTHTFIHRYKSAQYMNAYTHHTHMHTVDAAPHI